MERVRFAPSPTGPLHIGGVRTALFNYLYTKSRKGVFVLRVEDTDQNRYVPGAEEYILKTMDWLGLEVDEGPGTESPWGPYRQSERKDIYQNYIQKLIEKGKAYYAFDSRHFVTCSFMWPIDKMPDPAGGKRLLDKGCKVSYKKDELLKIKLDGLSRSQVESEDGFWDNTKDVAEGGLNLITGFALGLGEMAATLFGAEDSVKSINDIQGSATRRGCWRDGLQV